MTVTTVFSPPFLHGKTSFLFSPRAQTWDSLWSMQSFAIYRRGEKFPLPTHGDCWIRIWCNICAGKTNNQVFLWSFSLWINCYKCFTMMIHYCTRYFPQRGFCLPGCLSKLPRKKGILFWHQQYFFT
jgi:hypothetical protein